MMNAIRMVWVISRHYNTDERMVPLMELIAGEIAGKVRRARPRASSGLVSTIVLLYSLDFLSKELVDQYHPWSSSVPYSID